MKTKKPNNNLVQLIQQYTPTNQAEAIDQQHFLNFLSLNQNVYSRDNLTGHLTASCWIVNQDFSRALLIHHNIYNCWAPLGGHADNNPNLAQVALQEAQEESGLENISLINEDILDLAVMFVQPHQKSGKNIPQHFHFDIRYLLQANDNQPIKIAEREVSAARWFPIEKIIELNIDIKPIIIRVMQKVRDHHNLV